MSYFSKNLKYLRTKKGLTRQEVAENIKVNQSSISRWETEEMGITVENAYDLANYFGVSIADLIGKDLSSEQNDNLYDELDVLFNKSKAILSESDKAVIKTIIEERKKAIDKELNGE